MSAVGMSEWPVSRLHAALFAALLALLTGYYAVAPHLPDQPLWFDAALTALVLIPCAFALVLLALPFRTARGLGAVGLAIGTLAAVLDVAGLDVMANFAKLAALTALGFWFLSYFDRLSWVVLVAAVIPLVDSISVWRGPTKEIVTRRPDVFDALSFAFPVPDQGSFNLGLPDLLFFAVFLAAAARWHLRVGLTWLAMVASFGLTLTLTLTVDPFDIGGLPALPLLSVGFLAANADLLWRDLRRGNAGTG
jgi:hypothetical protein